VSRLSNQEVVSQSTVNRLLIKTEILEKSLVDYSS